jgi:hypothetical protein
LLQISLPDLDWFLGDGQKGEPALWNAGFVHCLYYHRTDKHRAIGNLEAVEQWVARR